jgi:hypothetical protein
MCTGCVIPFDLTRPLSEWSINRVFPTEQGCLDHRPGNAEDFQCVATDDPRLKEKLALARWYLMMASFPSVSHNGKFVSANTAVPLSDSTIVKTFSTEQDCLDHLKGFLTKLRTSKPDTFQCVGVDDPRLNEK